MDYLLEFILYYIIGVIPTYVVIRFLSTAWPILKNLIVRSELKPYRNMTWGRLLAIITLVIITCLFIRQLTLSDSIQRIAPPYLKILVYIALAFAQTAFAFQLNKLSYPVSIKQILPLFIGKIDPYADSVEQQSIDSAEIVVDPDRPMEFNPIDINEVHEPSIRYPLKGQQKKITESKLFKYGICPKSIDDVNRFISGDFPENPIIFTKTYNDKIFWKPILDFYNDHFIFFEKHKNDLIWIGTQADIIKFIKQTAQFRAKDERYRNLNCKHLEAQPSSLSRLRSDLMG